MSVTHESLQRNTARLIERATKRGRAYVYWATVTERQTDAAIGRAARTARYLSRRRECAGAIYRIDYRFAVRLSAWARLVIAVRGAW